MDYIARHAEPSRTPDRIDLHMKQAGKCVVLAAALGFAVLPLLSQTTPKPKLSFDVISIKPSAPGPGIRGGGARGDRYSVNGATLRMLVQNAYQKINATGPPTEVRIVGGPSWMDSDRYDVQATADCSGGVLSREQLQQMIQSMLESRFQFKAHKETRELPIYNLIVTKDGPKLQASADQTPVGGPTGPALPCSPSTAVPNPPLPPLPRNADGRGGLMDPNFAMPRGLVGFMFSPKGFGFRAAAISIATLASVLEQQLGRPVVDKTGVKGLFDFQLQFSGEGLNVPGLPPGTSPVGPTPDVAAEPMPSIFTTIQDVGLRLESSKGPVEILVIDSAQKPTEN